MPQITKIEEQKKRQTRFNVFVDDEFCCGVSEQTLIDTGIYQGQKISADELQKLINKEQESKALNKAFLWLRIRPRSQAEIIQKLKIKEFDNQVIEKILKRLIDLNLIDDKEFCRKWIEDRKLNSPRGRFLIQQELYRKGIDHKLIEQSLKKYYSSDEELNLATVLAQKKIARLKPQDKSKHYQKLTSYLAQRGFGWEIIQSVWDKIKS
ncbi:MAG: RecX family transcriptional regulator [Patescibacteria group bacterium]|nr:RecX family transcriptional regulator [Patescibacteria group bacterium]